MCGDEAAPATTAGPAPEWFRVRVSLERFFSDERARCYVAVPGARRVRWLARRLRALLRLPRRVALLSRGHLLPPAEPLALLRPDDPVEVIPATVDLDYHDDQLAPDVPFVASTPMLVEAAPKRKRRRKDQQVIVNNSTPPAVAEIDTSPASPGNTTRENIMAFSQELESELSPNKTKKQKSNKKDLNLILDHRHISNTDEGACASPGSTGREREVATPQEIDESDGEAEKLKSLKERALAALDEVAAARPRRRVRVRRRRRPAAPAAFTAPEADPTAGAPEPPPASASAAAAPEPAGDTDPDGPGACASSGDEPDGARAACVLRNPAARPREARLVAPLPAAAQLPRWRTEEVLTVSPDREELLQCLS